MKKAEKVITIIAILLISTLGLCGCGSPFELFFEIPDYNGVIGGISLLPIGGEEPPAIPVDPPKEPDDEPPHIPDEPPVKSEAISIDGYMLITPNGMNDPSSFNGNEYMVCDTDDGKFLLGRNGDIKNCPADMKEIHGDKYTFSEGGLIGVKSVEGEMLIPPQFIGVDIYKNRALVYDKEVFRVYDLSDISDNGAALLVSEVSRDRFRLVSLYSDSLLIADGVLCGHNFRPRKYDGYQVVGESGNIAIVKNEDEKLGYYNIETEEFIVEPAYAVASLFVGGYAEVRGSVGGEVFIIDESGKSVACFERTTYGFYDGYIFIEDEFTGMKLYDSKFSDTGLRFNDVYSRRVFGGYVIDTLTGRLFSLDEREYVGGQFERIVPFFDGFICSGESGGILFDSDLVKLAEFDEIIPDGDILCIKKEGKYYYFSRLNEK